MTLEQVHAEAPIGEVKEDSDDYKVFDGSTDKNPANKGKDRYYVKNANVRIVSALSKFTSVPKDKFRKVLRVEKAPLDKANDARAEKNKNFWQKAKDAAAKLFDKSASVDKKDLNLGMVFAEYQPTSKNPDAKPVKEGQFDMKNETSKMVKAVMESKFSDAKESLMKILKAKVEARKASIKAR